MSAIDRFLHICMYFHSIIDSLNIPAADNTGTCIYSYPNIDLVDMAANSTGTCIPFDPIVHLSSMAAVSKRIHIEFLNKSRASCIDMEDYNIYIYIAFCRNRIMQDWGNS